MKRSEKIVLGTLGAVAVGAFWLSGTSKEQPADAFVYASADACRRGGDLAPADCDDEWAKASGQHLSTAAKFSDSADCERAYGSGNCQPSKWIGSDVFVPALAGYMISRQVVGGARVAQPLFPANAAAQACPPGLDPRLRPDCLPPPRNESSSSSRHSSTTRWYRTSSGHVVVQGARAATGLGNAVVARSATSAPAARNSVVSRGGFGSIGRSYSRSS